MAANRVIKNTTPFFLRMPDDILSEMVKESHLAYESKTGFIRAAVVREINKRRTERGEQLFVPTRRRKEGE